MEILLLIHLRGILQLLQHAVDCPQADRPEGMRTILLIPQIIMIYSKQTCRGMRGF